MFHGLRKGQNLSLCLPSARERERESERERVGKSEERENDAQKEM